MTKNKKLVFIISAALAAALFLGIWYFAYFRPHREKAAANAGGSLQITVNVVHSDGSEKSFSVSTDETYLSEALLAEGIIAGSDEEYGIYITAVDGEEALMENNVAWIFTINGEYAMEGAESTVVEDGAVYEFSVTSW